MRLHGLRHDAGFGGPDTFGGGIRTPNLSRVQQQGITYNRFHVTAVCSPTRAAMLTGRNHHSVATGVIQEMATGYPGYCGIIPKSCATFAELLKQTGLLFSAVLIAGESILGVLIEIPIVASGDSEVLAVPESLQFGQWAGLAALGLVTWWLYKVAIRKAKH